MKMSSRVMKLLDGIGEWWSKTIVLGDVNLNWLEKNQAQKKLQGMRQLNRIQTNDNLTNQREGDPMPYLNNID